MKSVKISEIMSANNHLEFSNLKEELVPSSIFSLSRTKIFQNYNNYLVFIGVINFLT